jgi:hypothetical protein
MVTEGTGMFLDIEDRAGIGLSEPFRPARFSGDWNVTGRLIHGPVRDFNLMVARSFARSSLTVEGISGRQIFPPNDIRLIHALGGEITANGHIVAAGETIVADRGETIETRPLAESAKLAVCRISPL